MVKVDSDYYRRRAEVPAATFAVAHPSGCRRHLPFTRSWVTTGLHRDLRPPLIVMWMSGVLCGRYFGRCWYYVPRKRFRWYKIGFQMHFVPPKTFSCARNCYTRPADGDQSYNISTWCMELRTHVPIERYGRPRPYERKGPTQWEG